MSTSSSSPSLSEHSTASLEALDELIAEVAKLQHAVMQELLDRQARLCRELAGIDAELAELEMPEGVPARAKKKRPKARASSPRELTLLELTAELEVAPERTLNIRKANLDVKHTKALAKANPRRLQLGGKGSWPTVTLLPPSSDPRASSAPQGMFAFEKTSPSSDAQKKRAE